MKQLTKKCCHLIAPTTTPDFLGKVCINLALGLVTTSCYSHKTLCWGPACWWLGWGSRSVGFEWGFDPLTLLRSCKLCVIFSCRNIDCEQCDQVGQFIGLWATFQSLGQEIVCPNLPHSKAILVKVSKSLILLVKSFLGNFYRHLATFYWSHWFWDLLAFVPLRRGNPFVLRRCEFTFSLIDTNDPML